MKVTYALLTAAVAILLLPAIAWAHCDTLAGPVVADARLALDKGDVTPALKWIKAEHETAIRAAFEKALIVRSKGADAREIADRYFFETLVRLQRTGEGAPFTGLRDEPLEPPIALADQALESGSADELVKRISTRVTAGLRQRFIAASEARKHASDSVSSGREYVARYVEFIHYVERLDAAGTEENHGESAARHRPN